MKKKKVKKKRKDVHTNKSIGKSKTSVNPHKKIFNYFIFTRICLLILLFIAEIILSKTDYSEYNNVLDLFDNIHYLNIAKFGYTYDYQYAFFPLTPLLIRALGKVGFIILNQLCAYATGYIFYLIARDIFKKEEPFNVPLLYFVSPIAVFTCMFYSESLFMFLTVLAFYLYKTKKNYLGLGITLGLSVATRSIGSMLFFSLFIFMFIDFIKKREKFKNILITYIPATIISCLYPIYLYIQTGNPLYFVNVQFDFWGKIGTNILMLFFDAGKILFNNFYMLYIVDYLLVLFLFGYIIWYIIKHRQEKNYWELFVYLAFSLIAISSNIKKSESGVVSFYRYIFCSFPIYFMINDKRIYTYLLVAITGFVSFCFLLGIYFY